MQESNCVWCGALSETQDRLCHECNALYEADRRLPLNKHEERVATLPVQEKHRLV